MNSLELKATLERAGIVFEEGMDERELRIVEDTHYFRFPPDLRQFLKHALPISPGWVNWRTTTEAEILERLELPYEGMCFDVEHNGFWLSDWGERPSSLTDAFAVVKHRLSQAPKLIPICGHRFIPDRPSEEGNPVFSVHQTDIIYYGADLQEYFENEFSYYFGRDGYRIREPVRKIELWSRIVELNE